ncbi:MAG: potassium transporter Kup [Deltaproteobacteria bacterium]|nr:potassium transporter Kup [Deltaproteobacteria bacterium]
MSSASGSFDSVPPMPVRPPESRTPVLALTALGVVFGDIGTSPLYALKECVNPAHGVAVNAANVLGLLSLVLWSLTVVVAVKYLGFILRADNRGEGGILALLALCPEQFKRSHPRFVGPLGALVIFGAALLYGDGVITPAISVLSAVEGLEVATDTLKPVVVPVTIVILVGLFAIQSHGTEAVGRVFGPVMAAWFVVLGVLGLVHIWDFPGVLGALNPLHAVGFMAEHQWKGFVVLGSVVLVVTGGEALYADMGHFGRRPISLAWFTMVMPCLVLNYFGQGALIIAHPEAAENPFFAMVPRGLLTYALVALSTIATVIASQALISGAFSLTTQAVQLGYFPRVSVVHTSAEAEGQIYVPEVNWALAFSCVVLVWAFKSSSALAAAYGIAVTGTMAITSVVFFVVTQHQWRWPLYKSAALLVLFLAFDLSFLGANLLKFADGGYVPVMIGALCFVVMVTWKRGRGFLGEYIVTHTRRMDDFLRDIDKEVHTRVPGLAVFMSSNADGVPPIMLHHVRHNRVLHEVVILFTMTTEHVPRIPKAERITVTALGKGFHRVHVHLGFMQTVNVPALLQQAQEKLGFPLRLDDATYYLGRETFVAGKRGRMGVWAETLFGFLSRNARTATAYFGIPPDRVVELGMQLDL